MHYPLVLAVAGVGGGQKMERASWKIAEAFTGMGKRVLLVEVAYGTGAGSRPGARLCVAGAGRLRNGGTLADEHLAFEHRGQGTGLRLSRFTSNSPLTPAAKLSILSHIESTHEDVDIVIIDTGLSPSAEALFLNGAAHHIVVSVSPEGSSVKSALAFIEAMHRGYRENSFNILVTGASSEARGARVFGEITLEADKRLDVSIDYLGCVPAGWHAGGPNERRRAGAKRIARGSPLSPYAGIAEKILEDLSMRTFKGGIQLFWREMVEAGGRRGQ